ncbi:MAG: hypothetical protein FWC36_01210 [Spirochaetes bacterium]|nr:hypothetical protein [Spirochaetota bacterium]
MKRKFLLIIFVFVNIAYSTSYENEDYWVNITSLEEIIGEWKGVTYAIFAEMLIEIPTTFVVSKDDDLNIFTTTIANFEPMLNIIITNIAINHDYNLSEEEYLMLKNNIWEQIVLNNNPSRDNTQFIFEPFSQKIIVLFPNLDENRVFNYEHYYINTYDNRMLFIDKREETRELQLRGIFYKR